MSNVKGILQRLLENEVRLVLIGGLAATMHGVSTITDDVDVCFDFSSDNIEKLRRALADLQPRVRIQTGWVSLNDLSGEQLSRLNNLYLQTDYGGLDLLGSVREIGNYQEVSRHAVGVTIFNWKCLVLGIEMLIKVKEAIGRPKDKQVVLELKALQETKRQTGMDLKGAGI